MGPGFCSIFVLAVEGLSNSNNGEMGHGTGLQKRIGTSFLGSRMNRSVGALQSSAVRYAEETVGRIWRKPPGPGSVSQSPGPLFRCSIEITI